MSTLIAAVAATALQNACAHETTPYLAQDFETFDQIEDGWRGLARRDCFVEAADLIAAYRSERSAMLGDRERDGLLWHEGQMRADAGRTEAEIVLFAASREGRSEVMVPYVDATIAFLRGDRAALEAARERLLAVPRPDGFDEAVARFRERFPDREPPEWPLNVHIVDRFVACFRESYAIAYDGACAEAAALEQP